MRILLVADNTTEANWGCRATSFALRQLLAQDHEITGTITRELIRSPLTSSSKLMGDRHDALVRKFRRPRLHRFPPLGKLTFAAIDMLGDVHAPSHDIAGDADLLWQLRTRSPKARRIVSAIEQCDAVVVNGEGEMIFSDPERPTLLQTLAIASLAQRLGKRLFYVNGMISKGPAGDFKAQTVDAARPILAHAKVAVRDHQSSDVAAELLPGIQTTFFADALFTWRRHFNAAESDRYDVSALLPFFEHGRTSLPSVLTQPYIAVSGSSYAAKDQERAAECYTKLANELKRLGMPMILVATCNGDRFLSTVARRTGLPFLPAATQIMAGSAVMANARLFVSGRWHPSIMASLGGTPCVLMGSNSHKTLSLQYLLNDPDPVEFAAFPQQEDVEGIVARSQQLLREGVDRRRAISGAAGALAQSAAGLSHFVSE